MLMPHLENSKTLIRQCAMLYDIDKILYSILIVNSELWTTKRKLTSLVISYVNIMLNCNAKDNAETERDQTFLIEYHDSVFIVVVMDSKSMSSPRLAIGTCPQQKNIYINVCVTWSINGQYWAFACLAD